MSDLLRTSIADPSILGLSAFYHDSAACLVRGGVIVAAAEEERFSRKKHDPGFPDRAVKYCLEAGGLAASDLDVVAFYEKPFLKVDRILETHLATAPLGFDLFQKAVRTWLGQKAFIPRIIDAKLGGGRSRRYVFTLHHEAHAASAFFPSPFESAAIVTLDGVGEWTTCSVASGEGSRVELLQELRFPHSLGLLYSAFTYFAGFEINEGEYKLMGLAPYGRPRYEDAILRELVDLKEDGSFRLDLSYFAFHRGTTMTNGRFARLFGGPPRRPESPITEREMDLAASIQSVTEKIVLRIARHARALTGKRTLCLAGGVALNCVANTAILRGAGFDNLWIQPAAGDAGGALGAALFVLHQLIGVPRVSGQGDAQQGSLLGPSYDDEAVRAALDGTGAVYDAAGDEETAIGRTAELLAQGKVVGHFHGRMEFGPRALGSRSILADPRPAQMQSILNRKIKHRESFRPFAPAVLAECARDYFDLPEGVESPYMLLVARVRDEKRVSIPAVTHVDGTARVQTVDQRRSPRLYGILQRFQSLTGTPVLVNTSFNVRGEPIVESPLDAYRCFMATDLDALVIGRFMLMKSAQPAKNGAKAGD